MTRSLPLFASRTLLAALAFAAVATDVLAQDPATQPVSCATAEGDLRVLQSEREHAEKEQLKGVTALSPAGAVLGIVTGTEDDKLEALSGDYIKQIDGKVAEIKAQCGL
jgi:hypothetical protein